MHSSILFRWLACAALLVYGRGLHAQQNKQVRKYYPSGKLQGTGIIKNGKKTGTWIQYFENGKVAKKINYKNDVEDGLTVSFFADGKINEEIYCSNGNVDSLHRYFRTGKMKERTVYSNAGHDRKTTLSDSLGNHKTDYFFRDGRLIKQ